MYVCVRGIDFVNFCDFSNGFWHRSNNVVIVWGFFSILFIIIILFLLIIKPNFVPNYSIRNNEYVVVFITTEL
jgi:hypothetical protein